jgi:hypothetical protein
MAYILSIPKRHPFIFGVGVTTIKTGGVDFCIQKFVEKKENIDWTRSRFFRSGIFIQWFMAILLVRESNA